jgi:hypothetical protein
MLICIVERHCVVHHCGTSLGVGNVVGLLVGSGVGSKTPAAGRSRESWPVSANWEVEYGHVVEELGWGMGWCCTPARTEQLRKLGKN